METTRKWSLLAKYSGLTETSNASNSPKSIDIVEKKNYLQGLSAS